MQENAEKRKIEVELARNEAGELVIFAPDCECGATLIFVPIEGVRIDSQLQCLGCDDPRPVSEQRFNCHVREK